MKSLRGMPQSRTAMRMISRSWSRTQSRIARGLGQWIETRGVNLKNLNSSPSFSISCMVFLSCDPLAAMAFSVLLYWRLSAAKRFLASTGSGPCRLHRRHRRIGSGGCCCSAILRRGHVLSGIQVAHHDVAQAALFLGDQVVFVQHLRTAPG